MGQLSVWRVRQEFPNVKLASVGIAVTAHVVVGSPDGPITVCGTPGIPRGTVFRDDRMCTRCVAALRREGSG